MANVPSNQNCILFPAPASDVPCHKSHSVIVDTMAPLPKEEYDLCPDCFYLLQGLQGSIIVEHYCAIEICAYIL